MTWWEGALLGIVQGLTEFLPVSSSGHLVLGEALLGIDLPGLLFEAAVHVATLCAILWVYRGRVVELTRGAATGDGAAWRYIGLLALASLPAAAVGLGAEGFLSAAFEEPMVAASLLLVTGGLVLTIRWTGPVATEVRPGPATAFLVGVAQAVAILPGISRSGATVAVGTWRGVEVTRIAEFSFLLSVPAIAGAALVQGVRAGESAVSVPAPALAAGFVAAAVSGVGAIRFFVGLLRSRRLHRFAYYCWAVGGLYLAAAWLWPGLRS